MFVNCCVLSFPCVKCSESLGLCQWGLKGWWTVSLVHLLQHIQMGSYRKSKQAPRWDPMGIEDSASKFRPLWVMFFLSEALARNSSPWHQAGEFYAARNWSNGCKSTLLLICWCVLKLNIGISLLVTKGWHLDSHWLCLGVRFYRWSRLMSAQIQRKNLVLMRFNPHTQPPFSQIMWHIAMFASTSTPKANFDGASPPRFGVKNRIHVIHLIDFGLSKRCLNAMAEGFSGWNFVRRSCSICFSIAFLLTIIGTYYPIVILYCILYKCLMRKCTGTIQFLRKSVL